METATFHVRLNYWDGNHFVKVVRLRLSDAQVRQHVADRWLGGRSFLLAGVTIDPKGVREIHVTSGEVVASLRPFCVYNGYGDDDPRDTPEWKAASRCVEVTEDFLTGPAGSKPQATSVPAPVTPALSATSPDSAGGDPRRVFVVHGRNVAARDAMYAFLNSVGLVAAEWSPAATGRPSPYVGEVLDALFRGAQAVVVLLTPDDEARLLPQFRIEGDPPYEAELTPQARPNVLFEAGLAFGSHPDRTVLVELGPTRPFSDVGGRHTVRLDDSAASRLELAERLEACGCPVDTSGKHWLRAGSFGQAVRAPVA